MSSDAAFEGRVDALCREIGVRGRADQAVASASAPGVTGIAATAASELSTLKMSALRKHAKTKGANDEQMDLAADCDDERRALIELIVQLVPRLCASASCEPLAFHKWLDSLHAALQRILEAKLERVLPLLAQLALRLLTLLALGHELGRYDVRLGGRFH